MTIAGRVLGRGRAALARLRTLRSPRATQLRWLRRAGAGDAIQFGLAGTALAEQDPDRVRVGPGLRLGDQVAFHVGPEGRVELGADVRIGRQAIIVADRLVRVGDGATVGPYAALVDTWIGGGAPGLEPEPVEVGAGAEIGTGAVLGPGVSIAPGERVPPGVARHAVAP